jgi:hypothetical protein
VVLPLFAIHGLHGSMVHTGQQRQPYMKNDTEEGD